MIPIAEIDRARARNPISAVVSRFVPLRKAGGEWKACCPFHNERTPSFYVNDRKCFYHCFGCGAHGDVIDVLMRLSGKSFNDAVEELLGQAPETSTGRFMRQQRGMVAEQAGLDDEERQAQEKARALFNAAQPIKGTIAAQYLRQRAITGPLPDCLRFDPAVPYWHEWKADNRPTLVGKFPAMLAAAEDADGIAAVQITYLSPEATKIKIVDRDVEFGFLPAKKTKGTIGRGAVRLSRHVSETLGMGEGVETSLSAKAIYSFPVWASLGHVRFAAKLDGGAPRVGARVVAIPKGVRNVIIFADRDKRGLIDSKALEAAESLEAQGYATEVIAPTPPHKDFNDQHQEKLRGKA